MHKEIPYSCQVPSEYEVQFKWHTRLKGQNRYAWPKFGVFTFMRPLIWSTKVQVHCLLVRPNCPLVSYSHTITVNGLNVLSHYLYLPDLYPYSYNLVVKVSYSIQTFKFVSKIFIIRLKAYHHACALSFVRITQIFNRSSSSHNHACYNTQ